MVKIIFILMFMFLMVNMNNFLFFIFNFFFMLSFFMLMMKLENYNNMMSMGMIFSLDYYSYNLILMMLWIFGLIYMILNKNSLFEKNVFLFMIIILIIFFLVKNLLMFYFFFELSLIPIFLVVIYLGYNLERLSSAYYMLMYTLLISLPMLVYIMMIFKISCSWDFFLLKMDKINLSFWSLIVLIGAFLIKMPMYMFHIWLPKAHVEAPVYGSMVLAAILLKLGSYGLMQMLMIFLNNMVLFMSLFMSIGLIGGLIISLICLIQMDMKSLIAYSSVVHMNMMLCILMSCTKMGFMSAYIIMISHGLCSSGLFYMVNLYYIRSSSRLMMLNKGMINLLPLFMFMWFMFCSMNFSFPLTISFFGEIYLIMVLVSMDLYFLMYLILISLLSSSYSLYLFLYIYHGEINVMKNFNSGSKKDIMIGMLHFIPLMILMIDMYMF